MPIVKIYKNTTKEDINVVGVGLIPAGEQVSLAGEQHWPVVLENYPGVIDVVAEEEKKKAEKNG